MNTMTASVARTHFYRLLNDVEKGESVRISRNGKVIARIEPLRAVRIESDPERTRKVFAAMRELRKRTGKVSIEELLSAPAVGRR